MKNIIIFNAFLVYTIGIFFIDNYYFFAVIVTMHILLMIFLKISIKNSLLAVLKLLPFIIFTSGINMLLGGVRLGMIIGIRLILVCNMTYIFSKKMTPRKLQKTIETLLKPFDFFGINSKEIGIIVCIGISFIPILKREIQELKYSLRAKGYNTSICNIIRKPNYILTPVIISIIKRVGEIEYSLNSKGYVGQ